MAFVKIETVGYKQLVSSLLISNDTNEDSLAIMLPGMGYNNDMPLQYYAAKYFESKGFDILNVNYNYKDSKAFRDASLEEKSEWIRADVVGAVKDALNRKEYKHVVLVCKSIGTIAGLEALATLEALKHSQIIWLTPLTQEEIIVQALQQLTQKSLIVIGTNDPCYVKENVKRLSEVSNFNVMLVPDADHSLELRGDTSQSIRIIGEVINKIDQFYKGI
ncbi:alpha/beta family hydrolase [Bacillus horti]|uniref:Alpha/beta-hydrolase family hydrolase n=1 Tax=Caldalkalibacillus horti TaxID=77523 RepID=A0ABT9VXB4_9BACI|nr:alpha/beta family hydrolase [Bacillus horti]MDQ0165628.1 putative alpha/beta-hydrolase family hydrolase [Bacillus horti]